LWYLLYASIAALSDIFSGMLVLHPRASRWNQRYLVGLASGVVVSAAFIELLPESDIANNALYVALGFFTFYLIEKITLLHACGEKECESHGMGWPAVLGMASDNIVDGVGITIAYYTDPAFALILTVAVVIHEVPQGMASTLIMKDTGYMKGKIMLALTVAGVAYIFGATLAPVIPESLHVAVIAFVA